MFQSLKMIDELLANFGEEQLHNVYYETQNEEYEGATFFVRHSIFRSRRAKLTPNKKGYFVVFWEKNAHNQNQAFTYEESPKKIVITIIDGHLKGQFIFPKAILHKKGVLRDDHNKGKVAIRVYPDWEADLNKNATKTQQWQSTYFLDLTKQIDKEKFEDLYFS
ncbi:MepB family protein [Terribacillus sp. DMT04]|uniref:MepB family protein n=1 Tax=Terribacillus sp. DMT04 TaxID=2850441 RepID=UPI001C2CAC05|nr:MepB family protein [Terribacillus sp. DMT04]QXE00932.1 MepB family protein [Terribacillus sp. DMT04]